MRGWRTLPTQPWVRAALDVAAPLLHRAKLVLVAEVAQPLPAEAALAALERRAGEEGEV